jgi:hypothetical protein
MRSGSAVIALKLRRDRPETACDEVIPNLGESLILANPIEVRSAGSQVDGSVASASETPRPH